jgi:ferredoxin
MRVELDLISCRDNGECAISAPHIFLLDADGKQSLRSDSTATDVTFEVSEKFIHELEEAIIVCPMQAISILEGN